MATAGDIRDIMDLGRDGPRSVAPKKKKKLVDHGRISGMSREVQALMGDSVPPVAIVENPKYKSKPSIAMKMFKVRHWDGRPFTHAARKDNLVLKHWKRSIPGSGNPTTVGSNDVEMTDSEKDAQVSEVRYEDDFPSEKWNVHVNVVSYTDDQYEKYFKSDDWTKEETDYLMDLCRQFDLRWIIIADRYDTTEINPAQSTVTDSQQTPNATYVPRTMESMKSRYYQISAKMLEAITPASQMTNAEFQLWEKMKNFDAKAEATRKAMAEKLFERTKDEADEEKVLLEELHRITKNEEDFIRMRKDLYSRLETAPSLRRNERGEEQSTALYQSSHGLSMLLSTLLAKERKLKRAMPNGEPASAATPIDQKRPGQAQRRETIDSQADDAAPSKKGSVSQPVVRTLTPAEQAKYGVSHPQERLTSGVTFRHEKINRITTAKSQVQTQKIQSALTELGIPPRLLMPTERVCREFERLVAEVQLLLDARRGLEKVASEVKVLEEHKKIRMGQDETGTKPSTDAMDVDDSTVAGDKHEKTKPTLPNGMTEETPDKSTIENGQDDEADPDADENDEVEVEQSAIGEEDDDDADKSEMLRGDVDENDDAEEEEEEEDEDDDEVRVDEEVEDDEDDDAPGLEDLENADQVTDEEDEDGDEDEDDGRDEEAENLLDNEDEDEDEENDNNEEEVEESVLNGDADGEDEEGNEVESTSRPASSGRSHKRSASVISDASKAGSNRSGFGRKKRR